MYAVKILKNGREGVRVDARSERLIFHEIIIFHERLIFHGNQN